MNPSESNQQFIIAVISSLTTGGVLGLISKVWEGRQKYKQDGYQLITEEWKAQIRKDEERFNALEKREGDKDKLIREIDNNYNKLLASYETLVKEKILSDQKIATLNVEMAQVKKELSKKDEKINILQKEMTTRDKVIQNLENERDNYIKREERYILTISDYEKQLGKNGNSEVMKISASLQVDDSQEKK